MLRCTMGNFRRDNNDRGGRGGAGGRFFGGRSSFGSRDRGGQNEGPREMFKTVCSNCGKECEVPFRPTSGKPVYCSDCFEKMGGRNSDGPRPERRDRFERSDRPQAPRTDNNKAELNALNAKLDKIINLLEQKTLEIKREEIVTDPHISNENIEIEKVVKTPKVKKVSKK